MAAKPPLAPSTTSSGTPEGDSTELIERDRMSQRPKKARRTSMTQHACARCRQKKSKCDGKRPICGRCEKHGADCVYDVPQEGMTRMQSLQSQLGAMSDEHEKLKQLFEALRHGNDQESTTLLAKLRMGDSIDDLLSYLGQDEQSSSSGQQAARPHLASQRGPEYGGNWPTSPATQDGYWTTTSESSSRTASQTTIPQLQTRPSPPNSTLPHRTYDPSEGYYTSRPPQDARQRDQEVNFSSIQWQAHQETNHVSPYYTGPPSGHPASGKHSRDSKR